MGGGEGWGGAPDREVDANTSSLGNKKKWDQEMKEHEAEMRMSKNMLICIQ